MKNLLFICLMTLLPVISFADLVTEGEINRQFTILNLDDYPDYEFYIRYQTFYYDRGYQAGPVEEKLVIADKYQNGGSRSATSLLYARMKEGGDSVGVSSIRLGGRKIVAERNASHIEDDYVIRSIKDGVIELELKEQKMILEGGKEIKLKKGGISSGIELFGIDLIYIALPVVCLLGIVFFFLYRRRKSGRDES